MAQGTVAKRFLTQFAKTASARVLLALAAVALLLAGCGGDSSDTSSSTAAATGSAAEAGSGKTGSGNAGSGSGKAGSEPGSPAAGKGAGADGGGAQGGQPAQSSPGDRQSAPVPQPTGPPEPGITPQQRREATVASMLLESPSVAPSSGEPQALPAKYTCDGSNTSPALRWRGVPEGTAELVLFAMNLRPVNQTLFFDWAVAGLSPDLEEIEAGKLPKGAVAGRNGFGKAGYGICPEGPSETYMFTLFALPKKLSPGQGFDPLVLRKEVLDTSGNVGLLALGYTRG